MQCQEGMTIRISQLRTVGKPALTLLDDRHRRGRVARPIDDANNAVGYRRCDGGFVPIVLHFDLEL